MGKKLSELVEATTVALNDIFHLRTSGGIDKKIIPLNLLKTAIPLLLTTKGDLAVRGVTDAERLAAGVLDTYFKGQGAENLPIYEKLALRDTGIKIGANSRDALGDQIITGVDFESSVVIFLAITTDGGNALSIGFDDGTEHRCLDIKKDFAEIEILTMKSIATIPTAAAIMTGYIAAIGSDGFTITWTRVGNMTTNFIYLCFP